MSDPFVVCCSGILKLLVVILMTMLKVMNDNENNENELDSEDPGSGILDFME